ncbi:hypothetical protein LXL04_032429 [Taraxacum kok-saghyz]
MESEEAVPHSSSSSSPGNHREGIQPGERVRAPGARDSARDLATFPAAWSCRPSLPLHFAVPRPSPTVKSSRWHAAGRKPIIPCSLMMSNKEGGSNENVYRRGERRNESRPLILSGYFENSYISENSRTLKPLTFSKNRLRRTKNRSNTSPVAKKFPKKQLFFFKNFAYVQKKKFRAYVYVLIFCFKNAQIPEICTYAKIKKKYRFFSKKISANFNDSKRFEESRSRFFEMNNGLGDIGNWGSSRSKSFENSYIPENPRTPKPSLYNTYLKRFRIVMIKNVLEGSEVGFLKGITDHFIPGKDTTIKAKATVLEKPFASSCCIPTDENLQAKSFKFLIELQALRYGVDLMDPLFTFGRETWANNGSVQFSSPCSCFSGLAQLPEMVPELENYQGWNLCLLFDFLPLEKSCLIPQRHNV